MKNAVAKEWSQIRKSTKRLMGLLTHKEEYEEFRAKIPAIIKENLLDFPHVVVVKDLLEYSKFVHLGSVSTPSHYRIYVDDKSSLYDVQFKPDIAAWLEEHSYQSRLILYLRDNSAAAAVGFESYIHYLEFKLTWL